MAPTGSAAAGAPPKAGIVVQKKLDAERDSFHSDAIPRMTPELLQSICKERQMWMQPHLNTQLFLNYKGFLRLEGMEDYINVRSLHLDNNNISKIEGLDRMTELRSLHLGGNRISEIGNLESNVELRQLNLEGNAIWRVGNVRQLVKLETLNLSANRVENLEDLSDLRELPALANLDISHNSIEAEEGVIEFWSDYKGLKVLRYHGNPGVRHISHYRKRMVNALPQLTYMDERPVFPVERKSFQAWAEGGLTAMHEATKKFHTDRHAECRVDPERRELVTKRRQMAIERMDREAKERGEKEEEARLEAERRGASKAAEGGLEALQDYEKEWRTKVNLYGLDGVRAKVAQEMVGPGQNRCSKPQPQAAPQAAPQAPQQREHDPELDAGLCGSIAGLVARPHAADFDFAPPSRAAAARDVDSQPAASAGGKRQERPTVNVADFRCRSSLQERDMADLQFSVLEGDSDVCSPAAAPVVNSVGNRAIGRAAADECVVPLIWEQRRAETAAAEAACLDANFAAAELWSGTARAAGGSGSGPAAFRTNQLEGLD